MISSSDLDMFDIYFCLLCSILYNVHVGHAWVLKHSAIYADSKSRSLPGDKIPMAKDKLLSKRNNKNC